MMTALDDTTLLPKKVNRTVIIGNLELSLIRKSFIYYNFVTANWTHGVIIPC